MALTIRYKLVGLMMLMGLLPLVASLAVVVEAGSRLRISSAGRNYQWLAQGEAKTLATTLRKDVELYHLALQREEIVSALVAATTPRKSAEELKRLDELWAAQGDSAKEIQAVINNPMARQLRSLCHADPHCREILLTDTYGQLVAATDKTTDYYQADEEWWVRAYSDGRGTFYVPPIEFDSSALTWSISFCLPIYAGPLESAGVIGVAKVVLNLQTWMEQTMESVRTAGAEPALLDADGWVIYTLGVEPRSRRLSEFQVQIQRAPQEDWYLDQGKLRAYKRIDLSGGAEELHIQSPRWYLMAEVSASAALGPIYRLSLYVLISGLGLILLIFGGGMVAATLNLIRPLERLRHAADRVTAGDLSQQVATDKRRFGPNDEIGRLMDNFNQMVMAVKSSQLALAQASEMKSRFIRIAAHELRTPVSYIIGMIELLAAKRGDAELRRSLEKIRAKAMRLDEIITEMFKALPSYASQLTYAAFSLPGLVEEVVRELRPFAEGRGQRLLTQMPAALPEVRADREKLHDVLVSLLTNAMNFSPDGASSQVTLDRRENDFVAVSVADQCGGISHDEMDHLFEPFYGGRNLLLHSSGRFGYQKRGTGLGLTIARHFMRIQGGDIQVANADVGCVFTIILPIQPPLLTTLPAGQEGI